MSVSKRLRFEVFKRDGFACQYCGRTPPAVVLEVDHFIPRSAGGADSEENLLTSCFDCNRGKGARPASVGPRQSLAEREAMIREAAQQIKAYRAILRSRARRERKAIQEVEAAFSERAGRCFTDQGRRSVQTWLRLWTQEELIEAFGIALTRFEGDYPGLFAYVGGILRKWRQERQGNSDGPH